MAKKLDLKIKVDEKNLTNTFGKFVIQPMDRGYGITIGNALRRVLLTCIPGAAITNAKFDSVLHEFSSIEGVQEDVSDIIQNLKGVRFKLDENDPEKISMKLVGPCKFTSNDIQKECGEFKVLNKKHYITEVNEGTTLNMELKIGVGKGYAPSEFNELPNAPLGTIAIDSIFNPVTKVNYNVTPVPGAKATIELLTIEVSTDGSITPQDAVSYSSSVLIEQLRIVESISKPEVLEISEPVSEEVLEIRKLLNLTIDEMELSVRSHNCLQAAGIKFIYELVSKEENEMLKYKNFGRKSLTELVEKLDQMGLSFGMEVDKYLKEEA